MIALTKHAVEGEVAGDSDVQSSSKIKVTLVTSIAVLVSLVIGFLMILFNNRAA
ncbi:MAG: hypothetical protein H0T92_12335 [Pyrinomonadaceae bacterium]|nr:hypothetical protein [Pyrinomonadaceae bacterium]